MKNLCKYWPIVREDLKVLLKTTILIVFGIIAVGLIIYLIIWALFSIGFEYSGFLLIGVLWLTIIFLFIKDYIDSLPLRMWTKDFKNKYEDSERQRNEEH